MNIRQAIDDKIDAIHRAFQSYPLDIRTSRQGLILRKSREGSIAKMVYTSLCKIATLYEWFRAFTRERRPLTHNDLMINGSMYYQRLLSVDDLLDRLDIQLARERMWAARYIMGVWQARQLRSPLSITYKRVLEEFRKLCHARHVHLEGGVISFS